LSNKKAFKTGRAQRLSFADQNTLGECRRGELKGNSKKSWWLSNKTEPGKEINIQKKEEAKKVKERKGEWEGGEDGAQETGLDIEGVPRGKTYRARMQVTNKQEGMILHLNGIGGQNGKRSLGTKQKKGTEGGGHEGITRQTVDGRQHNWGGGLGPRGREACFRSGGIRKGWGNQG